MIPQVFHRAWLGGQEPEWTRPFADTWRELHPAWELRQWGDAEVAELFPLRNQDIYDHAEEIAPNHVGQLRSDVVRYEILYRWGGVWVDTDFECLRPIDPLIEGAGAFAAWEEQDRWIANGLMGAVADHPFVSRLIEGVPASVAAHIGQRPARVTGPQYLTRMQRAYGGLDRILNQADVYPFNWREIEEFAPGQLDPASTWPNAVACHWWANRRREKGISPHGAQGVPVAV